MKNSGGSLNEAAVDASLHPTCGCLNIKNRFIACSVLAGGMQDILDREALPTQQERHDRFQEQLREVRSKLDSIKGVNCIHEKGDGGMTVGEIDFCSNVSGPPCV